VRSRIFDSARWAGYQPRSDDIVIATYSKCGTTWTQRIVCMLVLKSAVPVPIYGHSPWPDMRIFGPVEGTLESAEAMPHRRFFKSHLPYDALPVYEGVKFIHVARDGRDAAMSLHNHFATFTPFAFERLDQISLEDQKFGTSYPRTPADPAEFFHDWVEDGHGQGDERCGFFHVENSYWAARRDPNMLLVHYNDLKTDREGEMRRIAAYLGIDIEDRLWPEIVTAAGFEAMKRDGPVLLPGMEAIWEQGSQSFLHKGTNGRWQDCVAKADLARYEARVKKEFSPSLAQWLEQGRLKAGDPRHAPD
jgi:aryl sulfotransferase